MTRSFVNCLSAVGALLVGGPGAAAQPADLRFHIPFGFTVSGRSLPAGTYQLSATDKVLKVRGAGETAFVLTEITGSTTDRQGRLVFYRYREEYVLGEARMGRGAVRELPRPQREPEEEAEVRRVEVPVR